MNKENKHWVETEQTANQRIEQARSLKEQAKKGGLKFETYLTPDLAEWVLSMVEQGDFIDPSEAVFVFMQQARDIDSHDDLKIDILRKRLEASEASGSLVDGKEVFEKIKKDLKNMPESAIWEKISQERKS